MYFLSMYFSEYVFSEYVFFGKNTKNIVEKRKNLE